MSAVKFTEKIRIKRTQAEVFDLTQDYENRLNWDTFLTKADLLDGATEAGMGVKSYCAAHNGLGMETEYVSFQRPKVTAVKMTKGPFVFKSFLGSWRFHPITPEETEVVFLYSFQLRFPFNLGNFLAKRILRKEVQGRLRDLKIFMEKS